MGMKGFKGFEKDFSCGGKQCEENTTYEDEEQIEFLNEWNKKHKK